MKKTRFARSIIMFSLILSAGSIYILPYMYQSYQKTMLEVFAITNTQLGFVNALYGIFAMLSYFPGGWLSDRVSSRKLLTISLATTSVLGFYLATFPSYTEVKIIHALLGLCTILPFWAALIKSTRNWGNKDEQAKAFGILDGGRGVVEVGVAFIASLIFASFTDEKLGLEGVIQLYSAMCALAAISVWFFVPETKVIADTPPVGFKSIAKIIKIPAVWLIAIVVLCGYTATIAAFNVAPFATDAFGLSAVFGVYLSNFRMLFRPFSSTGAGVLADKFGVSRTLMCSFAILIFSFSVFAIMPTNKSWIWLLWINTGIVAITGFALRAVYYALLEETKVPLAFTGTATGLISVVGYAPDIFVPSLKGILLDAYPGATGHKYFFIFAAGAVLIGFLVTLLIYRKYSANSKQAEYTK